MRVIAIILLSFCAMICGLLFLGSTICAFSNRSLVVPGLVSMLIFGGLALASILGIAKLSKDWSQDHAISLTSLDLQPPAEAQLPKKPDSDQPIRKENS